MEIQLKGSQLQLLWQFAGKPFQAHKILFKSSNLIGQNFLLSYEHFLKNKRLNYTFLTRLVFSTKLQSLARPETKDLVCLALISLPTEKISIDLVVKLQTVQQLTTLVTFLSNGRVQSQE